MNVLTSEAILWGAVRWLAVVGVIAGIFFLQRWLRRIEKRGGPPARPEDGPKQG